MYLNIFIFDIFDNFNIFNIFDISYIFHSKINISIQSTNYYKIKIQFVWDKIWFDNIIPNCRIIINKYNAKIYPKLHNNYFSAGRN